MGVDLTDGQGWIDELLRSSGFVLLKRLHMDGQSTIAEEELLVLKGWIEE